MPVFVDDPTQLSKARLKSDLIAHNVALPPAKSKKEVYVELHTRHVDQKYGADFSSDEEPDQGTDEDEPKDEEALDPSHLTDDCLKAALLQHGVKTGPIVASTRAVYERKLTNLLLSNGHGKSNGKQNGADEAVLYSDSEDEEDSDEELEQPGTQEPLILAEPADRFQQDCKQRVGVTKKRQPSPKRNLRNVSKSSRQTRSRGTEIPPGISKASSIDQTSGLAAGIESRNSSSLLADASPELNESIAQGHWSRSNRPVADMPLEDECNTTKLQFFTPAADAYEWKRKETAQEPAQEMFKDLVADRKITPTGIYATRRRSIKGAAGRPVQYVYPDTPVSPTTLQRQEVERRLVPLKIQILVFLIVGIILYVVYVCVEDYSFNPLLALMDVLNEGLDTDETGTQQVEEILELE